MRLATLETIAREGVAFDTETWLIQRGLLAPRVVCGSVGILDMDGEIKGALLTADQAASIFKDTMHLAGSRMRVLIGANIAFDLLVMAKALAATGYDAMPDIFAALSAGQVFDLQIAEGLHAVAEGHLGQDPRNGGPLTNPETGKRGRYSLATCVDLVLGRKDAKANDEWRMRYHELDGIPIEQWPLAARQYPVDDAKNTAECALAQCGMLSKVTYRHNWSRDGACLDCGAKRMSEPCHARRPHRNLHDLSSQVYAAFSMHIGAAWGFRVNQASADIIERHALADRKRGLTPFVEAGLVRSDGTENRSELKKRIALAYGAKEPCEVCRGTGKVPSPNAPLVRCTTCKGKGCEECNKTGKVRSTRSLINCIEFADSGEKIKTCDGTGYRLDEDIPRSEKEGISYGRDTLHESGDEFLMAYGDYLTGAKTLNVYLPYLRSARACTECGGAGTEDIPHRGDCLTRVYRDIPLTLRPNVLLETGRTSYDGVVQLFPRQSGYVDKLTEEYVPSLRECIEARPGRLFSSEDFKAGELVTHAQSCLWLVGHSELATSLLAGIDPHSQLAATVLGISYEAFLKNKKHKRFKAARQASKPFNFGRPGGMGDVKIVLQQRIQGPDTPHPNGPNWVKDDEGNPVRGYRGLRFCILMDGADVCGAKKLRSWRDRPIPPTCEHCINCAVRLGEHWKRQWPENRAYFNFISDCVENGMVITAEALIRWPWLQDAFVAGERLAPGEIMQHHSGRIRGGVEFTSGANGFFQGLLADAAKAALCKVIRECYDVTYRVPDFLHENSIKSEYGGGQSPLYGSRVIVFQHDELIAEHPESIAHEAASRISEVMRDELRYYCPDLAAACGAEPTLMRRWLKNAECVRDANGRLIPWEPKA